jgi:hypothetical protein
MSERFCVPCHRALEPGELVHLHAESLYAMDSQRLWLQFPTVAMYNDFKTWLREVHQVQLLSAALPDLPPDVDDYERLIEACQALRHALGIPRPHSMLDLLNAMLARLAEEPA